MGDKKEDCRDQRRIHFTLIPEGNSLSQFTISVKAPLGLFYYKYIWNNVQSDSWVPYTDIDKYQYHIVGQNIKQYSFGDVVRELRWMNDKFYIFEKVELLSQSHMKVICLYCLILVKIYDQIGKNFKEYA